MLGKISKNVILVAALFSLVLWQNGRITAQTAETTHRVKPGTPDLTTSEGYLAYLSSVRQNVALASFSLAENGSVDFREPIILHNITKKMPLASVVKIIHLAAYARAVEQRRLNPNRLVTVREWERTYLPGTDGFAHGAALEELGIPTDEFGFGLTPDRTVTVAQMVRAMIRFSDNATPDWLLANIGEQTFLDVIRAGGLLGQESPPFITGAFLALENHDIGLLSEARARQLRALSPSALAREVKRLHALYLTPEWRQAELQFRLENQNALGNRVFGKVVEDVLAKGTARDYANMFIKILNGQFLSPQISATMREVLQTAMTLHPDLYAVLGAKGGSLDTGVFNNASFSIAARGDYAGKRRITILFQNNIALDVFDQISVSPTPVQFEDRLATERGFARSVRRAFPLRLTNGAGTFAAPEDGALQ